MASPRVNCRRRASSLWQWRRLANWSSGNGRLPVLRTKARKTDVTIETETLKIDLHPDTRTWTVRYRMHNTGPKVQQDFFFPVERWGANPDSDGQGKSDDIDRYQITVDGKELKSTNVAGPKEEKKETQEGTGEANQESSETKEETSETSEATQDSSQSEEAAIRKKQQRCRRRK